MDSVNRLAQKTSQTPREINSWYRQDMLLITFDEELIVDWNFELAEAFMEQFQHHTKARKGWIKNY